MAGSPFRSLNSSTSIEDAGGRSTRPAAPRRRSSPHAAAHRNSPSSTRSPRHSTLRALGGTDDAESNQRRSPSPAVLRHSSGPSKARVVNALEALNGDGTIEVQELESVLQSLGMVLANAEIAKLCELLDRNHDGRISVKEFIDSLWSHESVSGSCKLIELVEKATFKEQIAKSTPLPPNLLREQSAVGLDLDKLQSMMEDLISRISMATGLISSHAAILLMHCNWDAESLLERFANDSKSLLVASCITRAETIDYESTPALCSVCFVDEAVSCLPCGHGLCADDWPAFLKSNLESGTVDGQNCLRLRCPGECCPLIIPPSTFEQFLSAADYKRYQNLLLLSFTTDGRSIQQCPRAGCDLYVLSASRKPTLTCKCGHSFCSRCGQLPHAPVGCRDAQSWLELIENAKKADMKFDEDKKARDGLMNCKPCPNPDCSVLTFKDGGCMFVVCSQCQVRWCWMCGQWGGGKNHSDRPEPHHVWECNNEVNKEWKGKDLCTEDYKARDLLNNVLYQRYSNHLDALSVARKQWDQFASLMISHIAVDSPCRNDDSRLIQKSVELLMECRCVLAWMYPLLFFEENDARVESLSKAQSKLETETEELCELLEGASGTKKGVLYAALDKNGLDEVTSVLLEQRLQKIRTELRGLDAITSSPQPKAP